MFIVAVFVLFLVKEYYAVILNFEWITRLQKKQILRCVFSELRLRKWIINNFFYFRLIHIPRHIKLWDKRQKAKRKKTKKQSSEYICS